MSKPESWKTWEGRVVEGKFSLRQYLGGSAHSAVFLTETPGPKPGKTAIKLIETKSAGSDLARLDMAAKLSHPHLVRIFASGRCQMDGATFVYAVMELADEDLSQILPQRPLAPGEVSDMLPPVLDALTYLHGRGLIHSRLKPSNVQAVGEQLKLSSDQIVPAGPPNPARKRRDVYDAPETTEGLLLPASDVWALGATVVEALTQKPMAEGTSNPVTVPETLPEPHRSIARECLQPDPTRRCSITEIYTRLQPEARSVPHQPEAPAISVPSAKRRPGFGVAIALVIAVLVALGVFVSRGKNAPVQNSDATPQPATQTTLPTSPAHEPIQTQKKTAASGGEVIHQVIPDIPQSAKNTITGTIKVTVRVEVDPAGKVTAAKLKSAGSSRYFAEHALRAAQGWQFSAPNINGQPTPTAWLLHFRFRRTSIEASAEQTRR